MRTIVVLAAVVFLASASILPAAEKAAPKNPDAATVVKGNNEFAFDMYGQSAEDGNLFFSPNSISTALAMTYGGARGDTAKEMAKTLYFTLPPDKLNPAFGDLIKGLNGEGKKRGYKLSVANALWGQSGFAFKDDFLKLTKDSYGAGLNPVNFSGNHEAARMEINAWVEKQTNDKIKELLKPGTVSTATRLVLTNAIYFKGDWNSPFKKDQTREEMFTDGKAVKVKSPMMHQTEKFRYLDAGAVQVLEMPYAGKELSMVVLLPRKVGGLADLEKSLTAEKLAGWLGKLHEEPVIVSLPKFKTTSSFRLESQLKALGMKKAFQFPGADFSGITSETELFISAVIHKAYVDVNEEGTEAAAATAVVLGGGGPPPMLAEFRADHPFVFLIRDTRNDNVLFLGRVVNPAK